MSLVWSLIKGSTLGLSVGAIGLVTTSVLFPVVPSTPPSSSPLTDSPSVAGTDSAGGGALAVDLAVDDGPATGDTPAAPTITQPRASLGVDTQSAALPEVGLAAPEPDAPAPTTELEVAAAEEVPVFPNPQSLAPQTPVTERDVIVSTEPAAPPAPVVVIEEEPEEPTVEVVVVEKDDAVATSPISAEVTEAPESLAIADLSASDVPSIEAVSEAEVASLGLAPNLGTSEALEESPIESSAIVTPEGLSTVDANETTLPQVPSATDGVSVADVPILDAAEDQGAGPEVVLTLDPPAQPTADEQDAEIASAPEAAPENTTPDPLPEIATTAEVEIDQSVLDAPEAQDETTSAGVTIETSRPSVPEAETETTIVSVPESLAVPGTQDTPSDAADDALVATRTPVVVSIFDRGEGDNALPQGNTGIRVNRIRTSVPAAIEPEEETPELEAAGALDTYSAAFENAAGLPLVSVVLQDDGSFQAGPDLIAALGLPVTILVDAAKGNASEIVAVHRAQNLEVAKTVTLPPNATAGDAAIALEASGQTVAEAVAYIDLAGAAQSDRDVMAQLALAASEKGRGLVVQGQGLNSGISDARAMGVPAAQIYRDLTDARQDTRVLARFLAQAAFQARQDGAVVLVGTLNAETLDALEAFAATPRGKQVALAPLSAALARP